MSIKPYPEFLPLSMDMQQELHPSLSNLEHGISEFTFAGLYLFRNTYQYHAARLPEGKLVLRGTRDGQFFYAFPFGMPDDSELRKRLVSEVDYVKGLAEMYLPGLGPWVEQEKRFFYPDRDNFDYLYLREELSTLSGKRFHKKRNHVNSFINSYKHREAPISKENIADAYTVLEKWHQEREREDDYAPSKESLDLFFQLQLNGYLVYVDDQPAAYSIGEALQNDRSYVIHFEKAIGGYRGIYQFINMAYSAYLPEKYTLINREQDLGNPGLRQSKMTYMPYGFVKKFRIYPVGAGTPTSAAALMETNGEATWDTEIHPRATETNPETNSGTPAEALC